MLQWINKASLHIIVGLTLILIVAGGIYAFSLGEVLRFLPDEQEYVTLADQLARTGIYSLDGHTLTAFRAPGYPFILMLLRLFDISIFGYRLFNFVLLGLAALALAYTLWQHDSPWAGLASILLTLGYAVLFFTAGTLYPQTLASLLFVVVLVGLLAAPRLRAWEWALLGLISGFLILTVPIFIFILPVIAVWVIIVHRRLLSVLIFLLTAALLLAAWTVRNGVVFRQFVFVSTNAGYNLLLGNSENTTPNSGTLVNIAKYAQEAQSMNEIEMNQYYQSQAIQYILHNPGRALQLYLSKVLNYFNYRNDLATQGASNSLQDLVMLVSYGLLLGLFLIRLCLFWKYPLNAMEWLLVSLYLFSALASAVFFTRIRFRLPFDYLLIWMDAVFLARLVSSWQARHFKCKNGV